jgi:hypothetical protein
VDVSGTALSGWPAGASAPHLQELYMHSSGVTGQLQPLQAPQLRCFTVHNNPSVCGPALSGLRCYDTTNTRLGEDPLCSMHLHPWNRGTSACWALPALKSAGCNTLCKL